MKKTRTMKALALLLALVMLTSCFVGGTFAKYVTAGTGSDSARVAKWGVAIEASAGGFANTYATDDEAAASVIANSVVSTDDVVAPGTSGELVNLTLSGTPEVATRIDYNIEVNLEGWEAPDDLSGQWVGAEGWVVFADDEDVYVDAPQPSQEQTDRVMSNPPGRQGLYEGEVYGYSVTTQNSDGTDVRWGYYYTWTMTSETEFYFPINIRINGLPAITGTNMRSISQIETFLNNIVLPSYEGEFAPGTDLSAEGLEITWEWPFEKGSNDAKDTALGNAETPATIEFIVTATVTQVD